MWDHVEVAQRIEWGAYQGEDLEVIMAIFLAQDAPNLIRRTPASGDGGIDLIVPTDAGSHVYQVKGFTGRFNKGRKSQVQKSWASVSTEPRLAGPILSYTLIVPIDPTPDEQAWFQDLTRSSEWKVEYQGEVYWHALAAKYPEVPDYYLFGGRERVSERSEAVRSAFLSPDSPLLAKDVGKAVLALGTSLNRGDPHYSYELKFSVEFPLERPPPDALSFTTGIRGEGWITTHIRPKHNLAQEESPIQLSLQIKAPAGVDNASFISDLDDHLSFGTALEVPEGWASGMVEAPGGFSQSLESATVLIGPAATNAPRKRFQLTIESPSGDILGIIVATREGGTIGERLGGTIHLVEERSGLSVDFRFNPPDSDGMSGGSVNMKVPRFGGQPAKRLEDACGFISHFSSPNTLIMREEFGRGKVLDSALGGLDPIVPLGVLQYVLDLAFLQDRADDPILVPDSPDPDEARDLRAYVQAMNGQPAEGTWSEITVTLSGSRSEAPMAAGGPVQLLMSFPLQFHLDGQVIELGEFTRILETARAATEQPTDTSSLRLVPGSSDRWTLRTGPLNVDSERGKLPA